MMTWLGLDLGLFATRVDATVPESPTAWAISVNDGSVTILSMPSMRSAPPSVVSTGDQTVTVS